MKYAILEAGGKQYLAKEGEAIEVDRLPLDVGSKVRWKEVLLLVNNSDVKVGDPYVKGATVNGVVVAQVKGPKIQVFKYKPKVRYRLRRGHRQKYTRVEINKITLRKPRKKPEEGAAAEKDKPKSASTKAKSTSTRASKSKKEA
ncbi:MAG: 50S ribosomal protein L21 [Anaerolineales bacterium]|nr:50S ribosomal protein L21 [Anaerolineales bacterium]